MKTIFSLALFFIYISHVSADPHETGNARTATLWGIVTNLHSGQPIPDANVSIQGTDLGTATSEGGYFHLRIAPGIWDVNVTVIGFHSQKKQIYVDTLDSRQIDFQMEPGPIRMAPVIVTATQTHRLQDRVTVESQVFSGTNRKRLIGSTGGEILSEAEALDIKTYGGWAGIQTTSIRGTNDGHTLILLDGMRLNNSQKASVDLGILPASFFERIEIVRGGHSAFYGSDAIGGAIHFVSHESIPQKGYQYCLRSTGGTFFIKDPVLSTQGLDFSGSHRIGPLRLFFGYNHMNSDGAFLYADPVSGADSIRSNNDYKADNYFIKTVWNLTSRMRLKTTHHRLHSRRGSPGSLVYPSPLAFQSDDLSLTDLEWSYHFNQFQFKMNAFTQNGVQKYTNPGGWIPIDSRHENRMQGFRPQILWTPLKNIHVFAGGEYRDDRLESTDLGEHDRLITSLFSHLEWRHSFLLSGLIMTWSPAVRWDRYNDISSQACPKLGWMIESGSMLRWKIRASWSRSFRAPSFNDLYWPDDGFAYGNPDLQPETGTHSDVALILEYNHSGYFRFNTSFFSNSIEDLILWSEVEPWIYSPLNIGRASISGREISLSYHSPKDRAYAELSHANMKALDQTFESENKGNRLIYRPDQKWQLRAGLTVQPFDLNVHYLWLSKRYANAENSESLSSYGIWNARLDCTFPLNTLVMKFGVQGLNLTDQRYYGLKGYPSPGREIRLIFEVTY